MEIRKIERITETLRKLGFSLTLEEFYNISVGNVLGRYGIKEKLSKEEFWILVKEILEICEENELKNMRLDYLGENDWKYKWTVKKRW